MLSSGRYCDRFPSAGELRAQLRKGGGGVGVEGSGGWEWAWSRGEGVVVVGGWRRGVGVESRRLWMGFDPAEKRWGPGVKWDGGGVGGACIIGEVSVK